MLATLVGARLGVQGVVVRGLGLLVLLLATPLLLGRGGGVFLEIQDAVDLVSLVAGHPELVGLEDGRQGGDGHGLEVLAGVGSFPGACGGLLHLLGRLGRAVFTGHGRGGAGEDGPGVVVVDLEVVGHTPEGLLGGELDGAAEGGHCGVWGRAGAGVYSRAGTTPKTTSHTLLCPGEFLKS